MPESGVAAGHLRGLQNSLEVADAASRNSTGDATLDHSSLLFLLLLLLLLLAGQNQEFRVGREHFANGVLKLPSGAHPAADLLGPLRGDALHVSLPIDRVGQGPSQVSFTVSTTTGGLSAARITPREGPRQLIVKEREMANEFKLALTQAGSLRGSWLFIHLGAILLQDSHKSNNDHRMRK